MLTEKIVKFLNNILNKVVRWHLCDLFQSYSTLCYVTFFLQNNRFCPSFWPFLKVCFDYQFNDFHLLYLFTIHMFWKVSQSFMNILYYLYRYYFISERCFIELIHDTHVLWLFKVWAEGVTTDRRSKLFYYIIF